MFLEVGKGIGASRLVPQLPFLFLAYFASSRQKVAKWVFFEPKSLATYIKGKPSIQNFLILYTGEQLMV